jgi:hypothetical protein
MAHQSGPSWPPGGRLRSSPGARQQLATAASADAAVLIPFDAGQFGQALLGSGGALGQLAG